jgi:DNA repair photolyase
MNDPAWCGQIQVRTNIADVLKNDLQEAGIPVRLFLTPVLPDIMDVDEMVAAIPQGIPVYLDKLRVFDKGSQNEKIYEWVKAHYPAYTEHYRKILFEADEGYYADLTQKYQNDPRITFMSELWKEDQ